MMRESVPSQAMRRGIQEPAYGAEALETRNPVSNDSGASERVDSPSARAILDAAISEKEFQSLVLGLAGMTGWLRHHQTIPYRFGDDGKPRAIVEPDTDPGFVDLFLVHPERGQVIVPELKKEGGKLSKAQVVWRDALLAAGMDWRLWYPHDWPEIEATLKGGE